MRNFLIVSVIIIHSNLLAQSANKVLPPGIIIKLIPETIENFFLSEDSQSKVIKLGEIHYAIAQKKFEASRHRAIKILLFDYKEAPIMYNQATKKWSTFTTVESDSMILRPTFIKDCSGWESYNKTQKNSQILLGVCDRFFLTIEGTNVELEVLRKVVDGFKFETFPR